MCNSANRYIMFWLNRFLAEMLTKGCQLRGKGLN